MKKTFLVLCAICLCPALFAINVEEKIARTPQTPLPFECIKMAPWGKPGYGISNLEIDNLPLFTYTDLGLTQKTTYETSATIFRRFPYSEGSFELLALRIGASDPNKDVLITLDQNGDLIDFVEVGVYTTTNGFLYIKQWRIDNDKNIIVTWIKIDSAVPISVFSKFGSVQGQRIDEYYSIDESGYFHLDKEIKYKPQTYTQSYFEDCNKELWDGDEVVLSGFVQADLPFACLRSGGVISPDLYSSELQVQRKKEESWSLELKLNRPTGRLDDKSYFMATLRNESDSAIYLVNKFASTEDASIKIGDHSILNVIFEGYEEFAPFKRHCFFDFNTSLVYVLKPNKEIQIRLPLFANSPESINGILPNTEKCKGIKRVRIMIKDLYFIEQSSASNPDIQQKHIDVYSNWIDINGEECYRLYQQWLK